MHSSGLQLITTRGMYGKLCEPQNQMWRWLPVQEFRLDAERLESKNDQGFYPEQKPK